MKKKTETILAIYNVLKDAKLTKMEDSDKYAIIKILRRLRPITEDFEAFKKDASERLKPENWLDIVAKVQQWRREGENTTLTEDERRSINLAIVNYEREVQECISEELNWEVDIDIPVLTEEAFEKLMASNDWEAKTALLIADEIVTD